MSNFEAMGERIDDLERELREVREDLDEIRALVVPQTYEE